MDSVNPNKGLIRDGPCRGGDFSSPRLVLEGGRMKGVGRVTGVKVVVSPQVRSLGWSKKSIKDGRTGVKKRRSRSLGVSVVV